MVAGLGLSAFCFSSIAQVFFPGDASALLYLLSLATSLPVLFALFIVRPIPLPEGQADSKVDDQDNESAQSGEHIFCTTESDITEPDCRTPLLRNRQEAGDHFVSDSALEIGRIREAERPNVHGIQLLTSPEFYFIIVIMTLRGSAFNLCNVLCLIAS